MLKRGNIKRSLTASEKLTSRSDLTSLDLEERLINHRKLWSEFEIVQSQLDLINSGTPELVVRHEQECNSVEDRYYAISAFFKKSISLNSAISSGPSISVASGHNSSAELTRIRETMITLICILDFHFLVCLPSRVPMKRGCVFMKHSKP